MTSKKDYIKIADAVNKARTHGDIVDGTQLVEELSFIFQEDNPNFDDDKFRRACLGKNKR